jgi:hypothetical protein
MTSTIQYSYRKSSASNYQDLLKVIALIAMLIDHLGLFILTDETYLRIIGRSAFPIFAFYAGYNFHHKIRHMIWIFGVILTVAYSIIIGPDGIANMLVGIALGQVYLFYAGKAILHHSQRFLKHFLAMLLLGIVSHNVMEYGTLTIAFMQVGYLRANGQKDPGYLLLAGLCLAILHQYAWEINTITQFLGILLAIFSSIALLNYVPHEKTIVINLKPISRNLLYIYTVTTLAYIFAYGMQISGFTIKNLLFPLEL